MQSDQLDQASDLTAAMTDSAIADIRKKARPEQIQNPDGTWPQPDCEDCGNEIPEGRLALGKIRCVYCQRALELKGGGR